MALRIKISTDYSNKPYNRIMGGVILEIVY